MGSQAQNLAHSLERFGRRLITTLISQAGPARRKTQKDAAEYQETVSNLLGSILMMGKVITTQREKKFAEEVNGEERERRAGSGARITRRDLCSQPVAVTYLQFCIDSADGGGEGRW